MRSGLTARLPAGADTVRARAFAHLDARLARGDPAPVALALSGGGDSLALLRLASEWCAAARRPLLALTVDHGLNPAARSWTEFAAGRAGAIGAAWRALAWRGEAPARGLAAAARAARHALLAQAAREAGASVVLLGHTRDDAVEGEHMRGGDAPSLGRLRVWGPSPVWPAGRGLALLRPLLDVGRAELRAWLVANGEPWWVDDPANDDPASPRARARALALSRATAPCSADPPAPLAALALQADADAAGRLLWRAEVLRAAAPPHRARVLAAAAVCVGGGERPPRGGAVASFAVAALEGSAGRTLAGARLQAEGDAVALARAAPRSGDAPRGPAGAPVWDGRFVVATDAPGWRVAALSGHAARLPAADRRALAALPAAARPMLPVLLDAAGRPRLPRPFGDGPGEAVSLVGPRLRLALGAAATEAALRAG